MKLIFSLLAVLVAAGTSNAIKIPDFGKGPLHDDLQDFVHLVPVDDIVTIVLQYAAEDAEFQAAMEYVMSDKFKDLVVDVESMPEIREMMAYLENAGINIYDIVNLLNDYLGIPKISPSVFAKFGYYDVTGGLKGLVQDIKAIMPFEKFEKLYKEKLEKSPAFSDFINKLKSPTFQTIVNKVYANKNFQYLLENAKAAGIDVKVIKDLLLSILGIRVPEKPRLYSHQDLELDLMDFINLLPVDKITEIAQDYMMNDEQVQRALQFALSQEFKDLVLSVETIKEYQDLVVYLDHAGLDIYRYINRLHQFLGLPEFKPPAPKFSYYGAQAPGGGLRALVDDILAILPVNDIKAMYYNKLQTSPAFADFIAHVKSESFQKIVDSLYTHEVFLDMIRKCKAAGLDLNALADYLSAIFGLKFPDHN